MIHDHNNVNNHTLSIFLVTQSRTSTSDLHTCAHLVRSIPPASVQETAPSWRTTPIAKGTSGGPYHALSLDAAGWYWGTQLSVVKGQTAIIGLCLVGERCAGQSITVSAIVVGKLYEIVQEHLHHRASCKLIHSPTNPDWITETQTEFSRSSRTAAQLACSNPSVANILLLANLDHTRSSMSWLGHPKWCSIFNQSCWWKITEPKPKKPQVDVVLHLEAFLPSSDVCLHSAQSSHSVLLLNESTLLFKSTLLSCHRSCHNLLFSHQSRLMTPYKVQKNEWKLMDKMSIMTNSLSLVAKCFGHVSVGKGCFRICFAPTIQLQISHQWINCCRPELWISPQVFKVGFTRHFLHKQFFMQVLNCPRSQVTRLHFRESETNTVHVIECTQSRWDTCLSHVKTLGPHYSCT